jgi:hypothetical protein
MSATDEIREYLHHLLDHQGKCTIENCGTCQIALNVYELVRSRIFSVGQHSGVANHAASPVISADASSNVEPRANAAKKRQA